MKTKLPVDVKEVLNAAMDIDAARKIPVCVDVLIDPQSSSDLQNCIEGAFRSSAENVRVHVFEYPIARPTLDPDCDLCVLAAGLSSSTGGLSATIRQAGVPVLVVTDMPDIVAELAIHEGHPLLENDLLSPDPLADAQPVASQQKGTLPICSDASYFEEPLPLSIDREASLLARMGAWIVDAFRDKRLAFALAFPFVRNPLSVESVNSTSVQNAGIGFVAIIPGADMPIMTLNQAKMLLQISAAYGQPMGLERLKELAVVVGGGFACRAIARQLAGALPGWGWAVKAGIGYAGTSAMGYAAIAYFEQLTGQGASYSQAAAMARAEYARVSAAASATQTPTDAAMAAVKVVSDDLSAGIQNAAARAIPAVQNAVDGVCEAVGTTPAELGRTAVNAVFGAYADAKDASSVRRASAPSSQAR